MIVDYTPVHVYKVDHRFVWVKREDLCTQPPGPPFSKCRGLYVHMKNLRDKKGIKIVGYVETPISMAGWGVAWCAKLLGMKAVIYEPQYKQGPPSMMLLHKHHWQEFDVILEPVPAGRTCVNQHIAKKLLEIKYGSSAHLLPIGIPSEETVDETGEEWRRTIERYGKFHHTVICVGSGTICAGILKVLQPDEGQLIGVLAYSKNLNKKYKSIFNKAHIGNEPLLRKDLDFQLIDPGWKYTESADIPQIFPCHRYYDLKAWQWLVENLDKLKGRVLFWNIGSEDNRQ